MIDFHLTDDPKKITSLISNLYTALNAVNSQNGYGRLFIKIENTNDTWTANAKSLQELGQEKRSSMLEICSLIHTVFIKAKSIGLMESELGHKLTNIGEGFDKLADRYREKACCLSFNRTTNRAIDRVMKSFRNIFSKVAMTVKEDSEKRIELKLAYLAENPPPPPPVTTQRSDKTTTSALTVPSNPTPTSPTNGSTKNF